MHQANDQLIDCGYSDIPVSAKKTLVGINSDISRYAFRLIFFGSECMSLHIALNDGGRYFRRHQYKGRAKTIKHYFSK